jgi:hypothetical protein
MAGAVSQRVGQRMIAGFDRQGQAGEVLPIACGASGVMTNPRCA